MNEKQPDLFTNVHKGIRRALFAACEALGRAEGDDSREHKARALLAEALHFVAHHGENEDVLLLPLLKKKSPEVFSGMSEAHAALDDARAALTPDRSIHDLYLAACEFTARYVEHMNDEEREFEPKIRAVLTDAELASFSRGSIERTGPVDQKMMITWMLPAMTRTDADAFLERVPKAIADSLRALAD